MKDFLKKWVTETLKNIGYVSVLVAVLSVFPAIPNGFPSHANHYLPYLFLILRVMVVILPIITLVEQLIMEFQLFSKNLWTRRIISFFLCLSITVCIFNQFGFQLKTPKILSATVLILITTVSGVIAYFIEDKRKKKDIMVINQKLSDLNKE